MALRTWHSLSFAIWFSSLLLCFIKTAGSGVPWEDLPAVAMDYKVHIDAGKEDCYYQYVQTGATFYASYQVLKGGDGMCGFAVRNPSGQIVHPYDWRQSGEYTDHSAAGGYYAVCIDNQFSKFAGKLVNLYISVIRYDKWEQYSQEIEQMNMNIENFTTSIMNVERNINDILQHQYHSRARESRDFNLLIANNSYVFFWSIIQIAAIVSTTALQVFFVRRLFEVKDTGCRSRI